MYVISGSTHQRLGASLAEEMNSEFCGVVNRHFPDGERYIRVLMDVSCLLYTSPSPRDRSLSRMPSSA